jgi:hypothetical protein
MTLRISVCSAPLAFGVVWIFPAEQAASRGS